jgi:uncharacterized membrane protein (UPF0127 family)
MSQTQGGKQAFNVTRQSVVATDVRMADHYFSRLMGLMGKPGLPAGHGLWITPCSDIHSCFMRFEFDAIFVDKQHKVLHLVERMKPWRVSKIVRGSKAVLELPAGAVAESGTQLGDLIELQEI